MGSWWLLRHRNTWRVLGLLALLVFTVAGVAALEISTDQILTHLASFSELSLFHALGLLTLYNFVLVLRLYFLIPQPRCLSLGWTANAIALGQAANYFLPARAGDALKVVILSRGKISPAHLPADVGTGVVLADKCVDISAVIAMAIGTQAYRVPGVRLGPTLSGWQIAAGVLASLLGVFAATRIWPQGRWRRILQNIRKGLGGTTRPTQLLPSILCGLLVWAAEGSALEALCRGQGYEIGLGQAILALIVLNALIAVPITFANFGPYEAALTLGLSAVGIDKSSALAIAIAHHVLVLVNALLFVAIARVNPKKEAVEAPVWRSHPSD